MADNGPGAAPREYSRCTSCGKRIARLGPAELIPCPEGASSPRECRDVLSSLVMGRNVSAAMKKEWHPETQALLERSGLTLQDIDAEIASRDRAEADRRVFTYDMDAKNLIADWINGDESRAIIVAKWALDQIAMEGNIIQITDQAQRIARDIGEYAESLACQDFEFDEAEAQQ